MSITINTSLKGVYTLSDANRKEICRSDNIITDWGMARLTGDPALGSQATAAWNRAFVNNLSQLYIGSGNSTPTRTNHQLDSIITTGFTSTNDTGTTGTSTYTIGSDLYIKFTKGVEFNFTSGFTIREVGCNWTSTFAATKANGIFSRATIPTNTVNAGDTLFLKYDLIIKTSVHQILENMPYSVGAQGVNLPQNRTNVRYFPFYKLKSDGTAEQTLNNGSAKNGSSRPDDSISEKVPPIFEDFGCLNALYIGSGNLDTGVDNTTASRQAGPRKWRLQIYNTSVLPSFSNIVSSTLTKFNNTSNVSTTTQNVSDPLETASDLKKIDLHDNIYSENASGNLWQRKLRFIFTPNQWISTADRMMLFQISDGRGGSGSNQRSYINNSIDCGILTTFETPYNPYTNASNPDDPDIYVGFDYTFNFTRL